MASSDDALGALQDLVAAGSLSVVLAFRSQHTPGVSYRLLRADVDEGFRRSAVEVATAAMRKLRDFDVVGFEASRLLGPDELFIRSLDEAGLAELATKVHQPALLESAGSETLMTRSRSTPLSSSNGTRGWRFCARRTRYMFLGSIS